MMRRLCLAAAVLLTPLAAAHARAKTYTGYEYLSYDVSVSYSFTTDGRFGALGPSDFTDYSVVINAGIAFYSFGHDSGSVLSFIKDFKGRTYGDGSTDNYKLTATSTSLSFLFDGSNDGVSVADPFPTIGSSSFCIEANGCANGENFDATTPVGEVSSVQKSSEVIFATSSSLPISAAPEPSSWTLLIGGVGTIGLMLRRKRLTLA